MELAGRILTGIAKKREQDCQLIMKTILYPFCLIFILLSYVMPFQGYAQTEKEYMVINHPNYIPGMFSVFNTVAGFLDIYEKGDYAGLSVNFGNVGWYYDPAHGPNWWEYYCEPILLGDLKNGHKIYYSGAECGDMANHTESNLSRERVHELISKYIKVKKFIIDQVDAFASKNFQDLFIIGVHYRGIDKIYEAPRISYGEAIKVIQSYIDALPDKNYRIFVATDEQAFLDFALQKFPDQVVSTTAFRSNQGGEPVHRLFCSPFKKGKQALVDVLLLSKSHLLIRCSSNLSLWATYFNPKVPVIELNKRY